MKKALNEVSKLNKNLILALIGKLGNPKITRNNKKSISLKWIGYSLFNKDDSLPTITQLKAAVDSSGMKKRNWRILLKNQGLFLRISFLKES